MKIKKQLSPSKVLVEKNFSAEQIKKMEEGALTDKGREMQIPGFRKGSAPLWKIKEIVAKTNDWDQLMSFKLQDAIINDWIIENQDDLGKITRIIDFKSMKPESDGSTNLIIEIEIEYFPIVPKEKIEKIQDKIKVEKKIKGSEIKTSAPEVEKGLLELQKKRTVLKPIGGEIKKDRLAFIKISLPGAAEKEHQDIFNWGLAQYGEEFDQKTENLAEETEKMLEIEDLHKEDAARLKAAISKVDPDFKDKKAQINLKVEKVFISEVPQLDDEFAKSLGNFQKIEELKKSMEEGLTLEKLYVEKDKRREELIEELLKNVELEVPQSLVEESAKREEEHFKEGVKSQYGEASMEMLDKRSKEEQEKFKKSFEERAHKIIKLHRIIEAIASLNKIVPQDKEIDEETQKIVASYPSQKEASEALGDDLTSLKMRVSSALTYNKTLEFLEKEMGLIDDLEEEINKIEKK